MRLFALEKFSGTFETLMTTPVSDLQVVSGQIHGGVDFLHDHVAAVAGCILVLNYFARGSNLLDTGTLGSTYLGIFLIGCLYMAVGCFSSALTRNQIVAAMISFAFGLGFFLAGFLAGPLDTQEPGPRGRLIASAS